ncbi:MAG: helix-turn-helix transcriptional regulator [Ardenticatenia bacterium]|nr:helix-turn-helix transcriptional regulator [Ardenticatenia bacterium]
MRTRIGAALRRLRLERGFTPPVFSAVSGVPQTTISAVELGRRVPGMGLLLNLTQALEVSPDRGYQEAGLLPWDLRSDERDEPVFLELWATMKQMYPADRAEVIR